MSQLVAAAARAIAQASGVSTYASAVVLGSGWRAAADAFGPPAVELPVTDVPGFVPPSVAGHAGVIRGYDVDGASVLCFLGRTHLYEGHGVAPVVHGVRVAAALGCSTIVLTNACGSLRPDLWVGYPVLISDHLNLTGESPLAGPQFVDLSDTYSGRLRDLVRRIDPSIAEGIYAQFRGPQYETPAEVRMAAVLGADLVGMSTALEAVAARAAGCEVLGISLVTNLAAGIADSVDHHEVLAVGKHRAARMGRLLADVIGEVVRSPAAGRGHVART